MNRSRLMLLIAALAVAIGAVWLSGNFLSKPQKQAQPTTREVLLAKTDIPRGTQLTAAMLEWKAWPIKSVTPEMIQRKPNQKIADFLEMRAISNITQAQPLLQSQITQGPSGGALAKLLRPGMRAVSVKINAATGVNGFIIPNDRVDVIMVSKSRATPGAKTVLMNVRVLALDNILAAPQAADAAPKNDLTTAAKPAANNGAKPAKRVSPQKIATLELLPQQAEILTTAQQLGQINLALRSLAGDPGQDFLEDMGPQVGEIFQRDFGRSIVLSRYGVKSIVQVGR